MTSQKKVLVISYACEPNETSEPGVGWNFIKEISKSFETTVITRLNNKSTIDKEGLQNAHFSYYDLPSFFLWIKKRIPLGTQFYYFFWQWAVYIKWSRRFSKEYHNFELLHHLNFGITWITPPAFLFKLPFIWGPIGGGDIVPFRFLKSMRFKAIIQESIYAGVNQISKISICSYLTRKKSNAILFRNESSKTNFTGVDTAKGFLVSETATSTIKLAESKHIDQTLHAICVGRMNYWKGFLLAVEGFHVFLKQGGKGKLELFGEGPEGIKIKEYIKVNKLQDYIFIRGFVDNNIILKKMKEAHVLIHPSFRDGGSWSIMEAMSNGLPVVCLNTSGPKDMVGTSCGLLIELKNSSQIKKDIGDGLFRLLKNNEQYNKLSANAIVRIKEEYNWSKRGEQIKEIYEHVLDEDY